MKLDYYALGFLLPAIFIAVFILKDFFGLKPETIYEQAVETAD